MNKILVVEDSKNIITVLKMCLKSAGYESKISEKEMER